MTRVLFVYRFCTPGGVETLLRFRLSHLPRFGIEPYAFFLRDAGGEAAFRDLADQVFIGMDKQRFLGLLEELRVDLVSSIDTFDVLSWISEIHFPTLKTFLELHSTYVETLRELSQQQSIQPDAILVPSEFQAQNILPYLPARVRSGTPVIVVRNAVDLTAFSPANRWDSSNNSQQIVAWVGRIEPIKGWREYLELVARLAGRPRTEFWMIGGAYEGEAAHEELRRQFSELGLASRIRWWPLVAPSQMPALYRSVAESGGLVLLTTRNESFGLVALEAQAAACPIIAPSVGGLPEVIDDGQTGFLYPPGSLDQAASHTLDLLAHPQLRRRIGLAASRSARKNFAPVSILEPLIRAVRAVLVGQLRV